MNVFVFKFDTGCGDPRKAASYPSRRQGAPLVSSTSIMTNTAPRPAATNTRIISSTPVMASPKMQGHD